MRVLRPPRPGKSGRAAAADSGKGSIACAGSQRQTKGKAAGQKPQARQQQSSTTFMFKDCRHIRGGRGDEQNR